MIGDSDMVNGYQYQCVPALTQGIPVEIQIATQSLADQAILSIYSSHLKGENAPHDLAAAVVS